HSIVIAGPHIQVLDTNTGDVLHSTAKENKSHLDPSAFLATSGDDKSSKPGELMIYKLLSSRALPKKPTCINFADNNDILVADKFGTYFGKNAPISNNIPHYQLHPSSNESSSGYTRDALDEHIRISWYPQGYTIESYCLGHQKYVSAIHIPSFSPGTLISGGGDSVAQSASISSPAPRIVATAIFWFSMDDNSEACIRHEPFYKPIIDFTLEDDGSVWVNGSNLVEVRRWTPDNFTASYPPPLALALNSCTLPHLEASAEERTQDLSEMGVDDAATVDGGSNDGGATKRELGRLKHKQALWHLQKVGQGVSLDFEPLPTDKKRVKSGGGDTLALGIDGM
ncbi:hypothetical protein BDR07DRAFT_1427131, partial [Suillus spraguei]